MTFSFEFGKRRSSTGGTFDEYETHGSMNRSRKREKGSDSSTGRDLQLLLKEPRSYRNPRKPI